MAKRARHEKHGHGHSGNGIVIVKSVVTSNLIADISVRDNKNVNLHTCYIHDQPFLVQCVTFSPQTLVDVLRAAEHFAELSAQ